MKERKHWKKRAVSLLMALAMVVTQIGVWNAGKESVQAAELAEKTLYFEYTGGNTLAVSFWNGTWDTLQVDQKTNAWLASVDSADYYQLTKVDDSSNWYSVKFLYNADNIEKEGIGFTIAELTSENTKSSKVQEYDAKWNNTNAYKTIFSDAYRDPAIQEKDRTSVISYASLNSGNDSEDTNEYVTKTLYFKYTGDAAPGILLWDNCGERLLISGTDSKYVTFDSKKYYTMNKIDGNWYQISFQYQSDKVKDQDVGFDIVELSESAVESTLGSFDSYWGAQYNSTHYAAYETIFSDKYDDPAIIQGDYDTVVSYADAIEEENKSDSIVQNAPITIEKVKKLSSDFIMGADISSMISELKSGVVYKDYDGKELTTLDDVVKFLAEQGINHIRVRVWNNPYDSNGNGYGGGNNDVAKAKEFADACRKAGINMLVDFHCSDLWTDPGKQQAPKAWKNYTLDQKAEALTTFIEESLNTIDPTKDVVDMVQVGNETTGGFIGETNVTNMCKLFSAGSTGVKAYNSAVKVVIHVESPQRGTVTAWAENLSKNKVEYDIIATSYYPYWHGTLDNLKKEFEKVKATYNKDVMVAETSYAYTLEDSDGHENTVRVGNNDSAADADQPFTEQGQATYIRNLIAAVKDAGGLGVYYWEPAWLTVGDTTGLTDDAYDAQVAENKTKWEKYGSGWASSYASEYDANDAGKWFGGSAVDNQAMFYPDGTATPALHVWNYVKTGSISNLVSVEKIETPSETITQKEEASSYTLPKSVKVTYSNNKDAVAEKVEWNEADKSKVDATKVGTYQIRGTVELSKEITRGAYKGKTTVDVVFTLSVIKANLITNEDVANFTTKAQDKFEVSDEDIIKTIAASENPYDNNDGNCMGWWNGSGQTKTVTITYTDAISLAKGNYVFSLYTQGSSDKVKLQILDTDNNVLFEGNPVELAGWKVWKNPTVSFALDKETNVKLRIEIETQSEGWGSVDVLYLHGDEKADNGSSTVTPSTPSTSDDADKKDDKNETTTEEKKVTATTPSGETVEATVTVSKDKDGNVTEAAANVTGSKAAFSAEVAAEIAKAAGTDNVAITASVTDKNGNEKYTVTVDSKNLTANQKLQVVAIDPETGAYKLVNAKTYTVGEDGSINVSLATGENYQLITQTEMKAVEKAILKTVEVKKSSATVKKGKKTQIKLSSDLDMDNVKSITYKTGKKSVATVSKTGKITAKKKGTVTIKAVVTLKNGKKKTVSMKLKVK